MRLERPQRVAVRNIGIVLSFNNLSREFQISSRERKELKDEDDEGGCVDWKESTRIKIEIGFVQQTKIYFLFFFVDILQKTNDFSFVQIQIKDM
jgi:hypothetical protein